MSIIYSVAITRLKKLICIVLVYTFLRFLGSLELLVSFRPDVQLVPGLTVLEEVAPRRVLCVAILNRALVGKILKR